jgi:hypothetical protein
MVAEPVSSSEMLDRSARTVHRWPEMVRCTAPPRVTVVADSASIWTSSPVRKSTATVCTGPCPIGCQ